MDIISADQMGREVEKFYNTAHKPCGVPCGLPNTEELWRIEKGSLIILTGIPGAGKSEIVDQIITNTIKDHDWKWCVFSPESWPLVNHTSKLLEKWEGRSFSGRDETRMTQSEAIDATQRIGESVRWLEPAEDEDTTFEWLFKGYDDAYKATPFDALVLDPYNETSHTRERGESETEFISKILTKFRNWGRRHDVAVIIVAHPAKLPREKDGGGYPVPTPYDINGSANWRNKADVCLTMWRDYSADNKAPVQLHVQKIRNRRAGQLGVADMYWSYTTGCYYTDDTTRQRAETNAYRKATRL